MCLYSRLLEVYTGNPRAMHFSTTLKWSSQAKGSLQAAKTMNPSFLGMSVFSLFLAASCSSASFFAASFFAASSSSFLALVAASSFFAFSASSAFFCRLLLILSKGLATRRGLATVWIGFRHLQRGKRDRTIVLDGNNSRF